MDQQHQQFAELLKAYEYGREQEEGPWQYALSLEELRHLGLTETDVRHLVQEGLLEHAQEQTRPGSKGRRFRKTRNLRFGEQSCFVLTERGVKFARGLAQGVPDQHRTPEQGAPATLRARLANVVLRWDRERRQLWLGDQLVKQFLNHRSRLCSWRFTSV